MPYSPSEVARTLGVSPSTVRNWTSEYGEQLTPAARGEAGSRLYSDADVAVLQYVAQLRAEKLPRAAVLVRLRETRFGEAETLVTQPAAGTDTPAVSPTERPTEALQPFMAAQYLAHLETRLDAVQHSVDERLQAAERRQQRTVNALLYGVIVGFALAMFLLAIAFALQQL